MQVVTRYYVCMRRRITIFALLVMILLAVSAWWYSPTQVLKRRCNRFFDAISFTEKAKPETRRLQVLKLGDFLDRTVALAGKDLPEEISSPAQRDEFQAIFAIACDACRFVAITERKIEFMGIDGETASVQATVRVGIGHPEGGKLFNGTHRLMLTWHHTTPGWCLSGLAWDKIGP
ncbi:MAG: hypothetical protein WCK77_06335 [Verrucomicrobiota bacterium]